MVKQVMKKSLLFIGLFASLMFTENVYATDIGKDEKISISFAYGDVDMNGILNTTDAQLIVNHYAGNTDLNSNQEKIADGNHDGHINPSDAMKVVNFFHNKYGDLEYINIKPLDDNWSLTYKIGDVNLDGIVNTTDVQSITDLIVSSKFEDNDKNDVNIKANDKLFGPRALKLADENKDGIISLADIKLITQGIVSSTEREKLTFTDSNVIVTTDVHLAGDANLDNKIDSEDANIIQQYYIGKELTAFELAICDVNGDGSCNSTDLNSIKNKSFEAKNVIVIIENNPFSAKEYLYGDLDLDGYITYKDKELLNYYINDTKNFDGIIKDNLLADVDKNGIVDTNDLIRIENILNHTAGVTTYKTNKIYVGKVTESKPDNTEENKPSEENTPPKNDSQDKPNEGNTSSKNDTQSKPTTPISESNKDEIENPNTGLFIPLISLGVLGVIAVVISILYKKKKIFFKIN